MRTASIMIGCFFLLSCAKRVGFEINNDVSEYTFRVSLQDLGDHSKMRKSTVAYWDDTIIWNGLKLPPTKDTFKSDVSQTYYGIDSVQRYQKYKARNWYVKKEYSFSVW